MTDRIEKLAAEYTHSDPDPDTSAASRFSFEAGYRRALADMQNASPAIASATNVSLKQILAAVVKELENG